MLGIGLIGAGMIGQMCHLASFRGLPGVRLAALAELRPDLGERAAARWGVPRVYRDHRALLADPEVQAVVVVTRRNATGPVVLDALEAGRHVLSEKPMCHTVAQAERLVAAAQARNLVYAVGYMKRHDPGVIQAKALLDAARADGRWGRLQLVRGWCYAGSTGGFPQGPEGYVMTEEARPQGLALWPSGPDWLPEDLHGDYDWFLNVNVHMLNLIRHLAGTTPELTAAEVTRGPGGHKGRSLQLDFGDCPGQLGFAEVASEDWHEGVEFVFEQAILRLDLPAPFLTDRIATLRVAGAALPPPAETGWAFARQAAAFAADVRAGRTPLASAADAVADLALAEAAWRFAPGVA